MSMSKANWLLRAIGGAWIKKAAHYMEAQDIRIDNLEDQLELARNQKDDLAQELEELRDHDRSEKACALREHSIVSAMERWWQNRTTPTITDNWLNQALGPIGSDHPAWMVMLALIRDHEQSYRDAMAVAECRTVDFNRGAATALAHMAYTLERHRLAAQAAVE